MNLTPRLPASMIPRMTRYTLPLALLGLLLLSPSCRHAARPAAESASPHYSHEEAEPVSNLPHAEFSEVTPGRHSRQH